MAFLQSFVSRLQQETQNLLPQVHEGSVSDPSVSSGNSTDLPASPEVKGACDACQSIFLGESVHRALRKETGLHNVDLTFPDLDLRNFMDNHLVQFITFQRSRSSLVSGSWAGCTMCLWLLTLYLRSYIPGTAHSDSLAGIMSLTDQPAFRVQWDLGFTVTRNEHFDSVVNIAVSNCPEKILMLEVAAEAPQTTQIGQAPRLFPGQLVRLDVGSDRSLTLAQSWIDKCESSHVNCPNLARQSLPKRVLEILPGSGPKDFRVRLYDSAGQTGKYAALSYCWGGTQPIMTTRSTLSDYQRELPFPELPQSIKDAIYCTFKLGLRYLWVDALCIVQNCESDRDEQLSLMWSIYKNAYITLQASSARTCHKGFLQTRPQRTKVIRLPCEDAPGRRSHIVLSPAVDLVSPKPPLIEPINERGWTLQESLVASRVLIFSSMQLFFRCPCGFERDGGQSNWNSYTKTTSIAKVPEDFLGLLGQSTTPIPQDATKVRKLWHTIVIDYTYRSITDPSDKLPALSAVAKLWQTATNDRYLAGCWEKDILYNICWISGNDGRIPSRHFRESAPTGRRKTWRAPTWSWASVDGNVWFPEEGETRVEDERYHRDPDLSFVECEYSPAKDSLPFGQIAEGSGKLTLKGRLGSLKECDINDGQIWAQTRHPSTPRVRGFPNSSLKVTSKLEGGQAVGVGTISLDDSTWRSEDEDRFPSSICSKWWYLLLGTFSRKSDDHSTMAARELFPPGQIDPEEEAVGLILSHDEKAGEFERVGLFKGNIRSIDSSITKRDLLEWFRDCPIRTVMIR